MITVATIHNDYSSKFGIPRQSGLVNGMESRIVMEPEFRNPDAIRGLEDFDYLWLLWHFDNDWQGSLTVRPPRLGGNVRKGVFATRSPFRPNGIGLSSVRITRILWDEHLGPVICVEGADMMDGTKIVDIKPYIPFCDSHPEARAGFTEQTANQKPLQVIIADDVRKHYRFTPAQWDVLTGILQDDPRPHYHNNAERVYSFEFANQTVGFTVRDQILTVTNK